MTNDEASPDVIVVGAGVIGLCVTRAVAEAGLTALCVGPHYTEPGTAAAAAGAMLGAIGEIEAGWQEPRERVELNFRVAAQRRYPGFLAALAADGATVRAGQGTVIVANLVNTADRANLAAMTDAATACEIPTESLSPDQVPGLRPARGHEAVGALFLPAEGWVDAEHLLATLDAAVRTGARSARREAFVSGLIYSGDTVTGVRLRDGEVLTAGSVVVAAGAGVSALLADWPLSDLAVPRLLPGKGVSLTADGLADTFPYVLRTPNRDFACGTHVVPRGEGVVYLGATNRISTTPGGDPGITLGEMHSLVHSAIHEINTGFRTANLRSATFGMRPLTLDHRPLIGHTGVGNLFVATGTYRNGMLMAPLVADIVRDELTSGHVSLDNPFSPAAARSCMSLATDTTAALEAGIGHLTSFIMEPGGHLPYDRQRELALFLRALGRIAVGNGPERDNLREAFAQTPVAELVPQLFYQLIDSESKRAGGGAPR